MSYSLVHKGIKYTLERIGNSMSYNVLIDDKPISNSSSIIYLDERKQFITNQYFGCLYSW